jgi:hypothetical protein
MCEDGGESCVPSEDHGVASALVRSQMCFTRYRRDVMVQLPASRVQPLVASARSSLLAVRVCKKSQGSEGRNAKSRRSIRRKMATGMYLYYVRSTLDRYIYYMISPSLKLRRIVSRPPGSVVLLVCRVRGTNKCVSRHC